MVKTSIKILSWAVIVNKWILVLLSMSMCCMGLKCRSIREEYKMQLTNNSVEKIEYYLRDDLLCTITDNNKICKITNILTNASMEKSKYNFKSFYFAKIMTTDQKKFRIECFEDQIRYKGKRYSVGINVQELFDKICSK